MKIKYLLLAAISGVIVTCDQLIKMYVHTHFALGESRPVIEGLFHLTYVRNFGAAFGLGADSHQVFREIFFLSMPPVALMIILAILRGVQESERWTVLALSLVFGGAIGNYIDRLRFRYVIDFLDFHVSRNWMAKLNIHLDRDLVWPTFNIADIAIVCGVSILLLLEFLKFRETKEKAGGINNSTPTTDKPSAT